MRRDLDAERINTWLQGFVEDIYKDNTLLISIGRYGRKQRHLRRIYQLACRRKHGNRFGISLTSDPWRTYKRR